MGEDFDKRSLIEDILKLVSEHRAAGLKSKLSPAPVEEAPELPGDPAESASGLPTDAVPAPEGEAGEGEMDPEMLRQLLESMGGE